MTKQSNTPLQPEQPDELSKYAIKAWVNTDDNQQKEMQVVQLDIAERLLHRSNLEAELKVLNTVESKGKAWVDPNEGTVHELARLKADLQQQLTELK